MPQIHTSVNALRLVRLASLYVRCWITALFSPDKGVRIIRIQRSIFKGIGKLPGGKYHIQLKPDAQLVQHPPQAVPEKKKAVYKEELERLCSSGIIQPVQGHTDWINRVVPVSKPDGSIRLCLDPKDLNKSIKRNQYYTKTIDEVSAELHGGKYFKLVDAKSDYRMIITPEGMKSDDKKVEAVKQMKAPKDKKVLQSFQGMVNYLKRYSTKLTRLFESLRSLPREETEWTWDSSHQDAFDAIKEELSRTPVLAYLDRKAEHIIQTDASIKGLGAVLLQEGKPGIYVSRTLTPAEERYTNIERVLLGVVFAMERLYNYVYGEPVRVETDHKPLATIWKKSIAPTSPRFQRLLLRLAIYEIKIEYICGKDNSIADALSRVDPLSPKPMDSKQMDVIPVYHITSNAPTTDN
ncbi:Retrovirus-related Pol polyprotein [Stylophora pistillata]|uniref:Retrovirus-related Pol polyprotein n=1 Tax=Stylophora pistillata TaxID=50429 RepID=A0A2B4RAD3_STYPI|nr:Retrovirus-related Pol polyprotein [Stylophora pistillata]